MAESGYMPARPPRRSRMYDDTSGHLMNIIADLSVTRNTEDREKKIAFLKTKFKTSDVKLDKLITNQKDLLCLTVEKFSHVSAKISAARKGCRDIKTKLTTCLQYLQCKRSEIQKLWLQSVEHNEIIKILQEIEDLKSVSGKVEAHLNNKDLSKATELLVSSEKLLEGQLKSVNALKDLKVELRVVREKLQIALMEKLHDNIYRMPDNIFLHTYGRDLDDKSYKELFCQNYPVVKIPREGSKMNHAFYKNFTFNEQQLSMILDCAYLLNTLNGTIDFLKNECSPQLMTIIKNTTILMSKILPNPNVLKSNTDASHTQESQVFLQRLLKSIVYQFKYVAINHYLCIDVLNRLSMQKNVQYDSSYDMAEIYSKIQSAIELFIADYLDINNSAADQQTTSTLVKFPITADISSFFYRKPVTRSRKRPLFKFDSSSHAINTRIYLQEQKEALKERGESDSFDLQQPPVICEANVKNVTVIYQPLKSFTAELEAALDLEAGTHCPLHSFLVDSVQVLIEQVSIEMNRLIERASTLLNTWQPAAEDFTLQQSNNRFSILDSTHIVNSSLNSIEFLILHLPDYTNHLMQLFCNVLDSYKQLCLHAYRELLNSDDDSRKIFSVTTVENNSAIFMSFPNWVELKSESSSEIHEYEESPEEIRLRNKEESEFLMQNDHVVSMSELILDNTKLHNLALFHESMEWLSDHITAFADRLPDIAASVASLAGSRYDDTDSTDFRLGGTTKGHLKKLSSEFESLGDLALLILHVEARSHCFLYLSQLTKHGNYAHLKQTEGPEPEIIRLSNALLKINEIVAPILQPKKVRYIFEGVGELLSMLFIDCMISIKRMNENGVEKMCNNIVAVQQTLSGATMVREVALDRARQYFELLNGPCENIFQQIMKEGPKFSEEEYSQLIHLWCNNHDLVNDHGSLNGYLEKLCQMLDEVSVCV